MSGTILKWGIPAFLTVIGGTLAAVATSGAAIPPDLETRAGAALTDPAYSWAAVRFDAQDAVLTGTATTQQMIDEAKARVAAVHGVRSVVSNVVLAEYVSPFPFVATVADGKLTLTGGLPDEAARAEIVAAAGQGATDNLRLMSGAPDRGTWVAAARYAVDQASKLDEGEVALADLALTLSGRARSSEAYEQLAKPSAAPQGVSRGFNEVEPPLAAPFEWHAEFDGAHLNLSGAIPSEQLVAELTALAPATVPVETSMTLASGAPQGFDDSAKLLLQNLLKLENGNATISGTTLSLDGAPPDTSAAESVRQAMTPLGANLNLGAPRVAEYWLSAERNGTDIVLDGFVPDAATRGRLEALGNVDASGLELGRGAPEHFDSAVDFVLDSLKHMSEGHANIQGTVITIEGRATSLGDYAAVETAWQLGAPQGLVLGAATVKPPIATPFTFTAEKSADGNYALSGYVPTAEAHTALRNAVPKLGNDKLVLADGNPDGFEADAEKALQVLALLDSGRVAYDGTAWSITGAADTPPKALAAEQAFAAAGLRQAGWSYDVTLPKPKVEAAAPIIDPYTWRAQKSADGTLLISGFAPTEAFKRYVVVHAGGKVNDTSALGSGAPDGFVAAARAGLDALLAMDQGAVSFNAGNWTLTGNVGEPADQQSVEAQLAAATDSTGWHVAIQATNAAPTPVEAPVAETPAVEAPVAEAPAVAAPVAEAPIVEAAPAEQPVAETPAAVATPDTANLPTEPAAPVAEPAAPATVAEATPQPKTPSSSAPLLACQQQIGAFQSRNAILFESGNAKIAETSNAALDELAGYLAACPEATINVEGYTDADGDADANLALSVSRAEAVVDALMVRGIAPERLYAVGYGESLPIASNETRAGKQANRRIAFTLADE